MTRRLLSNVTYTVNLGGIPFIVLAALVILGVFGGTDFERGVAGLLSASLAEVLKLEFKSRNPAAKLAVLALLPFGLVVIGAGLVLTLSGLS